MHVLTSIYSCYSIHGINARNLGPSDHTTSAEYSVLTEDISQINLYRFLYFLTQINCDEQCK